MFRASRHEWERWHHAYSPAQVITWIKHTIRAYPPAHREYRRLMAIVDADVYTRPDYADLLNLGNAIARRHDQNRRQQ